MSRGLDLWVSAAVTAFGLGSSRVIFTLVYLIPVPCSGCWSCCSVVICRRTPSCWFCVTRTRCCADASAGRGTNPLTGPGSLRWHGSYRAAAGVRSFLSRPRRCWPGIASWPRRSTTRASTYHALSNFRIEVDGDTASTSCCCAAWHWLLGSDESEQADFLFTCRYVDELTRTPAGWRVKRRRIRALGPTALTVGTVPDYLRVGGH